jgi:uncharacterized protein (TIGR03118 family)
MRTENRGIWGGLASCTLWAAAFPGLAWASNSYIVRNLTSDVPGLADYTDPNLKGAWGIAESGSSPFWISDDGSGVSTVYSSTGSIVPVVVQISPATRVGFNTPTGSAYNGGTGFAVTTGNPAEFIFATLEGTINGWNQTANATVAQIMADNSASGAVYTGLAIGTSGFSTYLYAADFTNGTIDVFDSNYNPVTVTNAFQDSSIPAGYAPFNVQNLGGNLYVAYAQQNGPTNLAATGAGYGYVDVYSTAGTLMQQLVAGGPLNAPWGMAIAPEGFGDYGNGLLVGNFGDGTINVFNPTTGAYIATLANADGAPISIPNLWALQPGNGGSGGDANAVYFTAAIPGPDGGNHGLLGRLQAAPIVTATGVVNGASFQPAIAANTWVTIAGGNLSGTTRVWDYDDFVNSALPTDIDGVVVTVNGIDAYVEYVSPGQLNVLLPVGLQSGQAQLQTYNSGLASAAITVQVQDVAPAFFLQDDGTHAVATHADGSLVGPANATTGATPAAPGETIVLYGTGFGATNPVAPEGQLVTTPLGLAIPPIVTIGATASQVTYAGLTYAGLYQINVTVPASTSSGDVPVVALVGSTVSSGGAAIAVQ